VVPMTASVPLAVLCGMMLGLGLWLLVSLAPRLSRPSLTLRIAPHVLDVSAYARELLDRRTVDPLPVFGLLLEPVLRRLRRVLDVVIGGSETTVRRLRQAGLPISVDAFRTRQLVWSAICGGLAVAVAVVGSQFTQVTPVAAIAFVVVAAVLGFLGRDYALQRQATLRSARIADELPTVLEFLTLSLSAGEGILDALRRVSRVSSGELASELGGVTTAVASGLPLSDTLGTLARDLQLPAFTRAVEQITGALERGTPLADVLRAQAQDSRDDAKRALLELSGKKEVAMLVPVVFLILPTTVLFAIFPGIFVLQVGF
jgi:tight adherence protein C